MRTMADKAYRVFESLYYMSLNDFLIYLDDLKTVESVNRNEYTFTDGSKILLYNRDVISLRG